MLVNFLWRFLITGPFVPAGLARLGGNRHGIVDSDRRLCPVFCIRAWPVLRQRPFVFHFNFADHAGHSLFLKDLAIAAGLFVLATSWPLSRHLDDAASKSSRFWRLAGKPAAP